MQPIHRSRCRLFPLPQMVLSWLFPVNPLNPQRDCPFSYLSHHRPQSWFAYRRTTYNMHSSCLASPALCNACEIEPCYCVTSHSPFYCWAKVLVSKPFLINKRSNLNLRPSSTATSSVISGRCLTLPTCFPHLYNMENNLTPASLLNSLQSGLYTLKVFPSPLLPLQSSDHPVLPDPHTNQCVAYCVTTGYSTACTLSYAAFFFNRMSVRLIHISLPTNLPTSVILLLAARMNL